MRWIAFGLALALVAHGTALAQSTPGGAPPPAVQRAGEVEYLSGGAGEEERPHRRGDVAHAQVGEDFVNLVSIGGHRTLLCSRHEG